jgi:tryptophan-rich sensory protein
MGISLYLVWQKGIADPHVKIALLIFAVQLVLNIMWSILFFGMQSPMLALIEIVLLWVFILLTITHFYPISRTAAYLLIPYILWVSFAAILNFSIFMLNKA